VRSGFIKNIFKCPEDNLGIVFIPQSLQKKDSRFLGCDIGKIIFKIKTRYTFGKIFIP
jgi:hypothetical protein|tara:strand:- start:954 stop:1127 length:174 start_codon:yes stop_codon:yes gene_type:complete